MSLRYATVCSGIGAPELAWSRLGWRCVFTAEIEKFPCAVLAARHGATPHPRPLSPAEAERVAPKKTIPNYGDITQFKKWPRHTLDVLAGGTPCQAFSIAGLRAGLDDPRGNLALTYLAIVERFAPTWFLWENVPGIFSSWTDVPGRAPFKAPENVRRAAEAAARAAGFDADTARGFGELEEADQSNDLDSFLAGARQLGYGCAFVSLDAQYFGVAQRRERLFVVGHLGGAWQRSAAVLFDRESMSGNPAPRRQKRQDLAGPIGSCTAGGGMRTSALDGHGAHIIEKAEGRRQKAEVPETAKALRATDGGIYREDADTLIATPLTTRSHWADKGDGLDNLIAAPIRASEPSRHADGSYPTEGHFVADTVESLVSEVAMTRNADNGQRQDPTVDTLVIVKSKTGKANVPRGTLECGVRSAECGVVSFPGRLSGTACVAGEEEIAGTLNGNPMAVAYNLHSQNSGAMTKEGNGPAALQTELARAVDTAGMTQGEGGTIVVDPSHITTQENRSNPQPGDPCHTLNAEGKVPLLISVGVRRLTPLECERLQGFPDGYTLIQFRGKSAADGPRYRAIGNSQAVPVIKWLGQRIALVQALPWDRSAVQSPESKVQNQNVPRGTIRKSPKSPVQSPKEKPA